jgi:hypothetical protein
VPTLAEQPATAGSGASVGVRPTLPPGIPVYPRATAEPLPSDDPAVAGRWKTADLGSAPYDYYADELPASGFPVVGLYPGGGGAVIRFMAGGTGWQVEILPAGEWLRISVRLDRP